MTTTGSVSETAHWIAAYRALETARPHPLFRDPLAARLAGPLGKDAPNGIPPWPMIVRTRLIDDLIENAVRSGTDCVLNLASGLDTRPYRLALPRELRWVEADLPAMVDEKERALAGETPRCALSREKVDLADTAARDAFLARALAGSRRALVLTEGLLVYLGEGPVRELARSIRARPEVKDWIIDVASPGILKMMQKATETRLQEADKMKFAPANGVAFYEALGFRVHQILSMFAFAVKYRRVPLWMRFFSIFPESNPRKLGDRPWGAIVVLQPE